MRGGRIQQLLKWFEVPDLPPTARICGHQRPSARICVPKKFNADGTQISADWRRFLRRSGIALFAGAFLAGCGSDEPDEAKIDSGYLKTYEDGPNSVVARVDKSRATTADRIRFDLEITSAEFTEIQLPDYGGRLGDFEVLELTTSPPELAGSGKVREVRTWILEPFLEGSYAIPKLEIDFRLNGQPDRQIVTEQINIRVTSVLSPKGEPELNEIADPVALPSKSKAWIWGLIIGGILGLAGGAFAVWFFKFRNQKPAAPPRPPHEIALEAIADLMREDLPGRGEDKEFYSRISDVLRRYIEGRFGIHAPGQTTEEFLNRQRFEPAHQQLLEHFLKYCDLVKFAEHQPTGQDFRDTVDACKSFINETRIVETAQPA